MREREGSPEGGRGEVVGVEGTGIPGRMGAAAGWVQGGSGGRSRDDRRAEVERNGEGG